MHKIKQLFSGLFLMFSVSLYAQVSRPVVDQISARPVSTNKIKIEWKLPENFNGTSLLIFKDTKPFTSTKQISSEAAVSQISPKSTFWTDTVTNYKEYYYAVVARLADGSLYNIVLPSVNATVKGAKVSRPKEKPQPSEEEIIAATPKIYQDGVLRELPLPYLNIIDDLDRKPTVLSPKVVAAGKELANGFTATPKEKLEPYYFDCDLVSPEGGDDYYLFEILKNHFVRKNYKESAQALQKFLSVNRSESTTNRAAFYLGEAQYYCGNYRHAVSMFLFVQDEYPVLSSKWIESSLDFYKAPDFSK